MKRDAYLDRFIKLLEATATRAHKDLDRERKRVDFLDGKVERLELVVLGMKNEAGREYADRSDAATAPRRPPIVKVPTEQPPVKPTFSSDPMPKLKLKGTRTFIWNPAWK